MDDSEKIINDQQVKRILSELGREMHIPPEIILADVCGSLSADGHSRVVSHTKTCRDCSSVLKWAKKFLKIEEELKSKDSESKRGHVKAREIESKLKLVAKINANRDEIVGKIAKLFLPKESWFSVNPIIAVTRKWEKASPQAYQGDDSELAAAAFTSGTSFENKQVFGIVRKAIDFVDMVHDLIIEQSNEFREIKQQLPRCIEKSIIMLEGLELDKMIKGKILEALSEDYPNSDESN